MAWLPRGEPARPLERRVPSEFVYPSFYELYQPSALSWLPSGIWPLYPEVRKLGDFQQPPLQALYKPEQLGWLPSAYYVGRAAPRGTLDLTVFPVQFSVPAFNPQNLEWIPQGPAPRTFVEIRKLGDFVQPAFAALYKPEGLQWLFEGQLSVRGIPYTLQSSWVVDPKPVVTVVFDPQFFNFQATEIARTFMLPRALQGEFATPPLPPGPDVVPPPPASTGLGGSSAVHPRRIVYEKGDKRKPKTFIDKIGEPFVELEKTAEPVPDAKSAGALPAVNTAPVREALVARLPSPLPTTVSTPLIPRPLPEDDDEDDLLLLS
jgi:hypothetical protein